MPKSCPTCAGVYESLQPSGGYRHACAPIVDAVVVVRAGSRRTVAPAAVLPTDEEISRSYIERPNKVDENVRTRKLWEVSDGISDWEGAERRRARARGDPRGDPRD